MEQFGSIREIREKLESGATSCSALVETYLERINARNPQLNAFLAVYEEEAREKAKAIDEKIAQGKAGKLAGLVIGLKDVICYQDHPLQASSQILDGFVSQFSATAVERLLAEDAIIIGRQNCDEFAMGASNENSSFGAARNAQDHERVPGGSSGGSALAVQAGFCHASLGSDTGGSVRQPAAFCGVYGLKPTYARISRYGLIAYASSFDCIGVLGKSPEDLGLILEVVAGPDGKDNTASEEPVTEYSIEIVQKTPKKKIAYLESVFGQEGVQSEIRGAMESAISAFQDQGFDTEAVELPLLDYILPTYYILTTAEASSNLARYDGVRYGYRDQSEQDMVEMYKKNRANGFGREVKRRIMLGTFVLSADYYDAFYHKAQKVRRLIKESTDSLLQNYDAVLLPTSPTTAFALGEKTEDALAMYLADIFTVHANLAGVPALSLPYGHDRNGLPIGLQLIGQSFDEGTLLALAKQIGRNAEIVTD